MKQRIVVLVVIAVVLLGGFGVWWNRPSGIHLVLITLDTTRADHLGCYGDADARTPVLDQLANAGIVCDRAYTTAINIFSLPKSRSQRYLTYRLRWVWNLEKTIMDDFDRGAVARMPLAESVGWLVRYVLDDAFLEELWDQHRGRCWTKVISLPLIVQLIHDALLNYESGRESFQKHRADGTLEASLQAVYTKLSRIPVTISQALLSKSTQRLCRLFPRWAAWKKPSSLRAFCIAIYDGKTIKRVAKRLKQCRGKSGGLLGGRALVAIDWETGLAIGMRGDLDGDSNDTKHLGTLVPEICEHFEAPVLHVSDRGFCDLVQPAHFTRRNGDHFLVRHHPKVKFHPDPTQPTQYSVNEDGLTIIENWGWMGSPNDRRRIQVRRIELVREGQESVVLFTDLLSADQYPASDLLWIYRERWGIECLFQKVTEVFGLSHLIGCSPEASLFQFAFCMLLYNMIQVVRGYIAQAKDREPYEISTELLFRDIERELIAWNVVIPVTTTIAYFESIPTLRDLQIKLQKLLRSTWSDTWLATPPQPVHRVTPRKRGRDHYSVYRLTHGTPKKKPRKNLAIR